MGFDSEYLALREKRKKKEEEQLKKTNKTNKTTNKATNKPYAQKLINSQDIAPVIKTLAPDIRTQKTTVSAPTVTKKKEDKAWYESIVKKPTMFDDGIQPGEISKVILGTVGDLTFNAVSGASNFLEGITDTIGYGIADVSERLGAENFADDVRFKAKQNVTKKILGSPIEVFDKWSVTGDTTDAVAQGLGMVGTLIAGGAALGAAGLGTGVTSAITMGATGASGFGSGMSEAYEGGATDEEAKTYGMIAGASEMLTEMLFGGLGKSVKAIGFSKGLSSFDDMLAKKVSNLFSNQIAKNVAEYGIKASGEGFEELLAGVAQGIGKKMTYMSEKDIQEILKDEKLLEQFVVGTVTSGFAQAGGFVKASETGRDFITGLTETEQKVVDKEVENRIAEKGEKITTKDKNKIYDSVISDLDKGYISTDTIESVLGGEEYETYKRVSDKGTAYETKLNEAIEYYQNEYDTLDNMPLAEKTSKLERKQTEIGEKLEQLKAELEEYKSDTRTSELKTRLSQNVYDLVKDSRLVESYNEIARENQLFQADYSKYKGSKYEDAAKKTLENAANFTDSKGNKINNTNRMRDLIESNAKFSADHGVVFEYKTDEQIKQDFIKRQTEAIAKLEEIPEAERTEERTKELADMKEALEDVKSGKKKVNGNIVNGVITINLDSPKALNRTSGHEITHNLEKAKSYDKLEKAVFAYAKSKGVDIDKELAIRGGTYSGVEGSDARRELVADLVGDYLFSDYDFVKHLSVADQNVFQRMWNEVKYLCKIATAGSKEARELERVKHQFEKAYRESANAVESAETTYADAEDIQYSLVEDQKTIDFLENQDYVVTYKAMQVIDGKLYPPMAAEYKVEEEYTDKKGNKKIRTVKKLKQPSELGKWQQSEENLEVAKQSYDAKKGYSSFTLLKGNGKELKGVAYNPYEHTSNIVLNDQFDSAHTRDNLVTVEYHIPVSELTSGYKAEYAKDAVGKRDWHTGKVASKLKNSKRDVYLTRWSKPVRILSDAEVAQKYKEILDKEDGVTVPWSVVTQSLREELEKVGVPIDYSDKKIGTATFNFEASLRGEYLETKKKSKSKKSAKADTKYSLSAEQEEYFKDSKVRDENGNLKVMYHGTRKGGFTSFDTYGSNYGLFGTGSYFTDNKSVAESYTEKGDGDNRKVYETYLNITNPLDMDAQANPEEWKKAFEFDDIDFPESGTNEQFFRAVEQYYSDEMMHKWEVAEIIQSTIQSGMGYDGITHIGGGRVNADGTRHQVYIAFEPEQIKNIDNVAPTTDPDIRYSLTEDSEGNKLTEKQSEYFANSKVVDRNGNLLKVYHTTKNDFTVFDKARKGEATEDANTYLGFFFTDDAEYMQNFPEFENGKTESYYLDMKNPIDMTDISREAFMDIVEIMGGDVGDASILFDEELEAAHNRAKLRGDNNVSLQLGHLLDELTGEFYYDDFIRELKPHYDELMSKGYDGVINYMDELFGVKEYIVLDSHQAKLTSNKNPSADADVRYSLTEEEAQETNAKLNNVGINYDVKSGTVSYSLSSLEDAFDYKTDKNGILVNENDYLKARNEYVDALAKSIAAEKGKPTREEYKKADRYLDSLFLIHDMIAADKDRLDYEAAVNRSAWVGNVEYGGSIDFSTLCAKRRLFTGTFDAIQNALPDTVLTDKDFLNIRKLLLEHGEESPCSMCYVEGSRAKHGVYVDKWLKEYLKTNPEWKPQIADFTSTTRLEQTRIQHPEAYKKYVKAMNKLSQRKPKEASVRTDYKGEILDAFKNGESVEQKNLNGGIRFNSFSDFEIIHALDCMQVLTDMARVGLNGQAYTKVKEFAEAFGNTGLKINLSLVAKDVDANGKLVMDETNGMNYAEALEIRRKYSDNVGTVIVVFNDAQLKAALSDSTIDFVLPFHRSQWRKSQYTLMGLPDVTRDYTNIQNDRYKNPKTGRPKKAPTGNIMPNEYWDFSLSGRENAQRYLDYINENSYIPKFDFLLNKVDGKWVLPDDAVGDGYFKLLIDFKMYNNDGVGSPQNPVLPEFNMPYIQQMLNNYVGGHQAFPVAHDVVSEFVEGKKNGKFSLSEEGEQGFAPLLSHEAQSKYARTVQPTDIAPTIEESPATVSKTEQAHNLVNEDDYAPITEEEALRNLEADREYINSLTDADMPPEFDAPIYSPDTMSIKEKTLKNISSMAKDILFLTPKEKRAIEGVVQKYSTSETQSKEELFNEIKKTFGEKTWTERIEEVAEIQQVLKGYKINVSPFIKRDITDYTQFMRRNFGKITFSKEGLSVDTAYMELSERYPNYFPAEIINPSDQLLQMADVANMSKDETQSYELDDDVIQEATDVIAESVSAYKERQLQKSVEKDSRAALRDELRRDKIARKETQRAEREAQREVERAEREAQNEATLTRSKLYNKIVEGIRTKFAEKGFDFVEVLSKAKNLSTFATVDNIPQRVMEKALGYKQGQILADETVNKVAQNESEGIKWLNSFTDRKNGILAQISRQYNIKPGSKKSAAAQMYAEGFYVNKNNEIIKYGDRELAIDFPNVKVQENIKGLANDPRFRQIYDETLEAINESRRRNLYPEIQRLDNYFLHFRAMEDTFSRLGLPFNPNDIRAKDLPTDLNGVTADLKPGQPFFASAMHREGIRTSYDLLGGLERYLSSAKNQIYHIDDIQTLRALRNYIADTYGQAKGLESLDDLTDEEAQYRIEQVYNSHLSTFAKFLNEEANVLAGKTTLIDRGLEGVIGRRGITFLDTLNKQVGSNMVGLNISSSLTNFLPVAQTFAKTNKFDFTKAFAQTVSSKIGSIFGKTDSFVENNPTIIRRKGAERFYRTPYQKMGDAGYVLMSAVDNVSTELIVRTKYNELIRKGMDEQKASFEADKWVSRLMGDRSLGQQPQLFNSKMLGLVTKFQLEVRNQLDSQFYDTVQEAKVSNEEIESNLLRNAKTAAKVGSTFFQLAVLQHVFGKAFESVAGYNPAFDIIEVLIKTLGFDDDEEDEDTVLDNIEEGFLTLLEDLPYTSTFTGGRIPISSALPIKEFVTGKDQYGNEKSRWDTVKDTAPYYLLPTGYGQIKKTAQGLGMFSDEHPTAGSYTDSGNLRFPVDDTLKNRVQAGVFGQYANKNARTYFDEDYAPLKEKQIKEYAESEMPIADYWKYREGLKDFDKQAEKAAYINGLDISKKQKDVLKSYLYDEEGYKKENPEKYAFLEREGIGYLGYKELDEDTQSAWSWAFKHQDEYEYYKENGVLPGDYSTYYIPMLEFEDEDDKAYQWSFDNPEKATLGRVFGNGVKEYRQYAADLDEIRVDKDENGKPIVGSAKKKKKAYIWNLDIDEGAKYILFKNEYNADDTYNYDIIDYLNSRDDISYDEMNTICEELGFKVNRDTGSISWD